MAKNLEWFIARRYLASRRKGRFLSLITLIAIGGVFLGVTALITVIAVMTGLQRDLQRMILGSTPHVYLFQAGRGGFRLDAWRDVLPRVQQVEGVTSASPFVLTQVGVMRPTLTYAQPGTLYGVDPTVSERPLTLVEQQIRAGELALGPTQSGLPGVLLGRGLADHLTVLPGDTIIVAAFENLKQDLTGEPRPKIAQFEVTGVFRPPAPRPPTQGPFPFPIPRRRPWPVPPGGGGRGSQGTWQRQDDRVNAAALRAITDDSGGRTEIVRSSRDLAPATQGIADELSQQYFFAYPAAAKRDGRWHEIRVEVRDNRYRVRARRGYQAS